MAYDSGILYEFRLEKNKNVEYSIIILVQFWSEKQMTMELFKNYYQARIVDGCGILHEFKLEKRRNVELYSLIILVKLWSEKQMTMELFKLKSV